MSISVTIELSDDLAERARAAAVQSRRRLEDVLVEWIDRAGGEPPVESLPDDQLLALCDDQMDPACQEELSELLARNREGLLQGQERERLESLMQFYRRGLVRKAQALKTAVERGLRPPLN